MDLEEYFFFLSSDDSKDLYSTNKPYDFTVVLPARIRLDSSKWRCALLQGVFSPTMKK